MRRYPLKARGRGLQGRRIGVAWALIPNYLHLLVRTGDGIKMLRFVEQT
ncbi:MAG: hypothetical protein JRE65_03720 [Deltaproteobacteria bacterium]|nr:hypothetical protein [Deltaproteobacteria bacterium]